MQRDLATVIDAILKILAPIGPLLITLALLLFIWGLVKFIRSSGNEEDVKKGRQMMTWGIIGLFVIITIWGLVAVLQRTFSGVLDTDAPVDAGPLYNYDALIR